ncbi:kinase-like domain-containing protein [Aspergillus carlsbadensis]|nr:kinase-like domain-containing protein [Aspergillus carlsbadensis]
MRSLHSLSLLLHSILQYTWYPVATIFKFAWRGLNSLHSPSCNVPESCPRSPAVGRRSGTRDNRDNIPIHPPNVEVIETRRYLPRPVTKIIARGGGDFIGFINNTTVLKYPCVPGNLKSLNIEAQLLEAVGTHPRIIASHLCKRLHWCRQAAEAVEHIHQRNIVHCDINLRNFLLNNNLDLLLADFQGMLKAKDGTTLLDGLSRECSKSFAPRPHGDDADRKTDLFALGSAIYFIILGYDLFPDLDGDDADDEIAARFRNNQFPADDHACAQITDKRWNQQYTSAGELLFDIVQIQQSLSNSINNPSSNDTRAI